MPANKNLRNIHKLRAEGRIIEALSILESLTAEFPNFPTYKHKISEYKLTLINSNQIDRPNTQEINIYSPNKNKIDTRDIIIIIPSCKKNEDKANAIRATWAQHLDQYGIRHFFVIGQPNIKHTKQINDTLIVPCADDYESLLLKLTLAYHYLYNNIGFIYLYKIDDDCFLNVHQMVTKIISQFGANHYYGGAIQQANSPINNKWHYGKCSSPIFEKPYKFKTAPTDYAKGGYGYFLRYDIIPSITTMIPKMEEDLRNGNYSYEDIEVALILRQHAIKVSSIANYCVSRFTDQKNFTVVYDLSSPQQYHDLKRNCPIK